MANGEHKILIVDDDPAVLDILGDFIAVFGFEYETATDGLEAVEILKKNGFDIVLTDMMMPNMDGMELLNHIHNNYPETKVMVVTGYDRTFTYTDVINAGASDFISKPFNPDELEAKINRIIREIQLMRQLEHLSISDGLTGLYNRRHFDNKIIEEARRAHRQKHRKPLLPGPRQHGLCVYTCHAGFLAQLVHLGSGKVSQDVVERVPRR